MENKKLSHNEILESKISEIFNSYSYGDFEPTDCLKNCQNILETYCAVDGKLNLLSIEDAKNACNAYGFTSNKFRNSNALATAIKLLVDGWNRFSSTQLKEKQRIYRAGLGMYLSKIYYFALRDDGAAFRWAILGWADDSLGRHPGVGSAARQMLHNVLGMSEKALDEFKEVAEDNYATIENHNNDWSLPFAFAEDLITKFAFKKTAHSQLFAMGSEAIEYPINTAYFNSLLERANSNNINANEKGKRLEDLASYLFLLLPSLTPRRNMLDETLAGESDIVIRNLNPNPDFLSELLGRHFLVECKNWDSGVGVQSVGYFLHRMRLTHAQFGIIFAKSGITGDDAKDKKNQENAAHSIIRKTFHEDGNICIVIKNEDLIELGKENITFRSLLIEKYEQLRFGKERFKN